MHTVAYDKAQPNVNSHSNFKQKRERKKTHTQHAKCKVFFLPPVACAAFNLFGLKNEHNIHKNQFIECTVEQKRSDSSTFIIKIVCLKPYSIAHIQQLVIWVNSDDEFGMLLLLLLCFGFWFISNLFLLVASFFIADFFPFGFVFASRLLVVFFSLIHMFESEIFRKKEWISPAPAHNK